MTPAPPVYLDECVDHDLVDALRVRGFTVGAAADEGMSGVSPGGQSFKDWQQLDHATATGRLILTHNETHFRRLDKDYSQRQPPRLHGGIVILPQDVDFPVLEARAAMMLDWIATLGPPVGRFFKWGRLQYQLTHGLRLPGYTDADVRLALGQQQP